MASKHGAIPRFEPSCLHRHPGLQRSSCLSPKPGPVATTDPDACREAPADDTTGFHRTVSPRKWQVAPGKEPQCGVDVQWCSGVESDEDPETGLCGAPLISVMEPSISGRVHCTRLRCVLRERQVRPRPLIIAHVGSYNSPQVRFPKHNHVIEALPAQGSDDLLDIRSLPRASGSNDHLLDTEGLHSFPERRAVNRISVADQEAGQSTVAERFHELLRCAFGRRMVCHVEVDDPASIMGEHDEDEQDAKRGGWNREEINRHKVADMVVEERSPGFRTSRDSCAV
jgi:hypothetical protein